MNTTPQGIRHRHDLPSLVRLLWMQPLWALPFGLFFGTVYGGNWDAYRQAYAISLVFAYAIGLTVWAVGVWLMPRLRPATYEGGTSPVWIEIALYAGASLAGSYLAGTIVHFTIAPGFFGSGRSLAVTGMFAAAFTTLVMGLVYARVFYRQSVMRAAAVERARAELAQAELRTLRAQVNPHFLFNALNTIASLVRSDPDAAEDTTTRLAELFRHALRASDREHRPLAEELEFVRHYLAIEHARFGARLVVEEAIEPGVEAIPVPSLLLQPLVENAVRHGAGARPEGGRVRVVARRDGELLELAVEDDGPGMREGAAPSGNGFGLHSVRERLRALGPPHAIEITSSPGRGTRVGLRLPVLPADPAATSASPFRVSRHPGGVS